MPLPSQLILEDTLNRMYHERRRRRDHQLALGLAIFLALVACLVLYYSG